jgi:hypothetical protein
VAEARKRARDFLTACPKAAYMAEVEISCELPSGGIAFTVRRGFALRSDRAAPRPVGAVTPHFIVDLVRTNKEHSRGRSIRGSTSVAEVTYFVALPFLAADDGVAAGEPTECLNSGAAVARTEALSRKQGHVGAVACSRTGDPATGEFSDAVVLKTFGDVPDDLGASDGVRCAQGKAPLANEGERPRRETSFTPRPWQLSPDAP